MKKIFGITLALFAASTILFVAFRPDTERSAGDEGIAAENDLQASAETAAVERSSSHEPSSVTDPTGADLVSDVTVDSAADKAPRSDAAGATAESLSWLDHFKEGQGSYSNGDYAEACRAFDGAIARNADNYYLHYMLGMSQWKGGRPERAAESLNRSIELNPSFVKGWVNLARVRRELEDPLEAVALCEKALAIDDSCDAAWNVAGLAYLDTGDRDKAIDCFTKAVSLNPENAFALNNLGLTYIYEERFDKALLPLEQAVEIAPGVAFMHNNLGIVYENLGRTEEAAHQYAAAVDTPSGHAKAQANLRRVLPMLSVEEEARLAEFYQIER